MSDSIKKLSRVNHIIQGCIVIAGLFLAVAHYYPSSSTSPILTDVSLFLAVATCVSFALTFRISGLEKAAKKKDQEIIAQLEQTLKQESKKKLPVRDATGKEHYLSLKVPPDEE